MIIIETNRINWFVISYLLGILGFNFYFQYLGIISYKFDGIIGYYAHILMGIYLTFFLLYGSKLLKFQKEIN